MSGIQQIEHLLVIEDRQGKRTIVLKAATCSLGRDRSNNIVLDSHSISRHHALLLRITKPNATHHSFRIIDGDLQGKRSTNGLKINDRPCTSHDLQHGDMITFGDEVKARYYVSANQADVEFLTSCQAEEVSGFLSNLSNPLKGLFKIASSDRTSTEAALERLASIPELNLNPIIEIDLDGNITYLNPSTLLNFPDLQELKLAHPVLAEIIPLTQNEAATYWVREIEVGNKIYQQNIHLIVSGQLIRSYLVDITAHKQTELALRESEERFRLALDNAPIGMALVSPEGRWLKVNRAICEIVGYSEEELLALDFQTITYCEDLDSDLAYMKQMLRNEIRTYQMEKRYLHKKGHLVWALINVSLVRDAQEQPSYFIAQIQDITERKQAEEALKEGERRFRAIFNSMFQLIGLLKPDGTLLEANQTALDFGGIAAEEIIGRPFWEAHWWTISPQTQEQLKDAIAAAARGQFVRYEVDVVGVWDTVATIDFSIKPVFDEQKNVVLLISEGRDITQKKQAEEALQQSEERFRQLVDYSPVGIFQTDPQGDCIFVNPRWSKLTGLSPGKALYKGWVNGIYPEDRQQVFEAWYEATRMGRPFAREFRYQTPQGIVTWVFANATAMRDEAGEIIGYLGTVTDISDQQAALRERKQAEAALRESEARFRLLVDRAPVGIFQSNAQGECLFVNPRWLEMTGLTLEESLGEGWLKPIHPDDRKQILKGWYKAKRTKDSEFHSEFRYETREGKLGWAFGKAIAIRDKAGTLTGYFGTVIDISSRKQIEALLQQSHDILELRVKQRTSELAKINDSLKAEIAERKRAEEEIRLLQSITKAITEAPNFEEAIAVTLQKVCQTIGWNFAEAWVPDPQDTTLLPSSAWYGSTEALLSFREASLGHTFVRHTGVPGRVWATQQPEWTQDVSQQPLNVFLRADVAKQVGLKSALGVPIVANEIVIAVFVFFTFDAHQEDKRMVDLVKSVAKQLGLFIERKRAEDALRSSMATNRALINAIPDWLFRISKDGIFVNFKAVKDTHHLLPGCEFLGKHIYEVFPSEVAQPTLTCVENVLTTGETQILECQLPTDSGLRDYEIRIAVSAEAEVMAIMRDITERKRHEEDMTNALEKEKQLNELKSRFVVMTSHEFRTPLATILSSTELIEHYGHKWSEEKRHQYLQKIQASVKHMTNLLNDVLVLGKAEAGKLEFAPSAIAIESFCRELVEEVQLTTSSHKIAFAVKKPCSTVHLDEKLLRHILTNLLSNAIKYSPGCDRVDFEIADGSQGIAFRIRDYGIGIPQDEQEKLFDSFHRASNVGNISGTGLGLAIVKKSVDLHGGTIEINSQIGEGTTFIVTIPC